MDGAEEIENPFNLEEENWFMFIMFFKSILFVYIIRKKIWNIK